MAVSLLGLKVFGTGFASVYRVVNSTSTQLGETFAVVTLTGAPSGGPFQVGETLAFGGGGTAVLTEAAKTGPDRLIIASPSGAISGSVTGGTSGATATVSAAELLESAPAAGANSVSARVVQFRGGIYAFHYNTIYRLDETLGSSGGRWVEAHRLSVPHPNADESRYKTGLFVLNKNGSPHVVALWSPTVSAAVRRLISSDGATWSELQIYTGTGIGRASSTKAIVFNNRLFMWGYDAGAVSILSWDPATDSAALVPGATTFVGGNAHVIVAGRNRLFFFAIQGGTGYPQMFELVGGAWSLQVLGTTVTNGISDRMVGWLGNDGHIYTIFSGTTTGYFCHKWNLDTMTVSDVSNPVLPAGLRNGAGASASGAWDVYGDVEVASTLGDDADLTILLWFSTGQTAGSLATSYQFNGDGATMTTLGTGGPGREIALPHLIEGGGHRTFASGELHTEFLDVQPIVGGERWRFYVFKKAGDPDVTDVKVRALYRVVTDGTKGGVASRWGYVQNPSAGAASPGNREITGLVADSVPGALGTLYTIDVLLVSQDAVPNFSLLRRAVVAYT